MVQVEPLDDEPGPAHPRAGEVRFHGDRRDAEDVERGSTVDSDAPRSRTLADCHTLEVLGEVQECRGLSVDEVKVKGSSIRMHAALEQYLDTVDEVKQLFQKSTQLNELGADATESLSNRIKSIPEDVDFPIKTNRVQRAEIKRGIEARHFLFMCKAPIPHLFVCPPKKLKMYSLGIRTECRLCAADKIKQIKETSYTHNAERAHYEFIQTHVLFPVQKPDESIREFRSEYVKATERMQQEIKNKLIRNYAATVLDNVLCEYVRATDEEEHTLREKYFNETGRPNNILSQYVDATDEEKHALREEYLDGTDRLNNILCEYLDATGEGKQKLREKYSEVARFLNDYCEMIRFLDRRDGELEENTKESELFSSWFLLQYALGDEQKRQMLREEYCAKDANQKPKLWTQICPSENKLYCLFKCASGKPDCFYLDNFQDAIKRHKRAEQDERVFACTGRKCTESKSLGRLLGLSRSPGRFREFPDTRLVWLLEDPLQSKTRDGQCLYCKDIPDLDINLKCVLDELDQVRSKSSMETSPQREVHKKFAITQSRVEALQDITRRKCSDRDAEFLTPRHHAFLKHYEDKSKDLFVASPGARDAVLAICNQEQEEFHKYADQFKKCSHVAAHLFCNFFDKHGRRKSKCSGCTKDPGKAGGITFTNCLNAMRDQNRVDTLRQEFLRAQILGKGDTVIRETEHFMDLWVSQRIRGFWRCSRCDSEFMSYVGSRYDKRSDHSCASGASRAARTFMENLNELDRFLGSDDVKWIILHQSGLLVQGRTLPTNPPEEPTQEQVPSVDDIVDLLKTALKLREDASRIKQGLVRPRPTHSRDDESHDGESRDDESRDEESRDEESRDEESRDEESRDEESRDDESRDEDSDDDESHDEDSDDDESHDEDSDDDESHDEDSDDDESRDGESRDNESRDEESRDDDDGNSQFSFVFDLSDAQAVEFIKNSVMNKIWLRAFNEDNARARSDENGDTEWVPDIYREIRERITNGSNLTGQIKDLFNEFLSTMDDVLKWSPPQDYTFTGSTNSTHSQAVLIKPNLMQKYCVHKVKKHSGFGNWSDTGMGKSLSAVLAARELELEHDECKVLTILLCPGKIAKQWSNNIQNAFSSNSGADKKIIFYDSKSSEGFYSGETAKHLYLIISYGFFSGRKYNQITNTVKNVCYKRKPLLTIVDEVHSVKQREPSFNSLRSERVEKFIRNVQRHSKKQHNHSMKVFAMTATPFVNDIREPVSLLRIISDDKFYEKLLKQVKRKFRLEFKRTGLLMLVHHHLMALGVRMLKPEPMPSPKKILAPIGPHIIAALENDGNKRKRTPIDQGVVTTQQLLLTRARLPFIVKAVGELRQEVPGKCVIVYSYYRGHEYGILKTIERELEENQFKVKLFTPETRAEVMEQVLNDTIDFQVLVTSRCLAEGIDGLQNHFSGLVTNGIPYTDAERYQVFSRIHRAGNYSARFIDVQAHAGNMEYEKNSPTHKFVTYDEHVRSTVSRKRSDQNVVVEGKLPREIPDDVAEQHRDTWVGRMREGHFVEDYECDDENASGDEEEDVQEHIEGSDGGTGFSHAAKHRRGYTSEDERAHDAVIFGIRKPLHLLFMKKFREDFPHVDTYTEQLQGHFDEWRKRECHTYRPDSDDLIKDWEKDLTSEDKVKVPTNQYGGTLHETRNISEVVEDMRQKQLQILGIHYFDNLRQNESPDQAFETAIGQLQSNKLVSRILAADKKDKKRYVLLQSRREECKARLRQYIHESSRFGLSKFSQMPNEWPDA